MIEKCTLCGCENCHPYHQDAFRQYYQCDNCELVVVPSCYWLSREEEKAVYDLHENNENDQGYRRFLSRLSEPLLSKFNVSTRGLDFGCGPGPTLSKLMEERGHQVSLFDPIYYNDRGLLKRTYGFVSSTEVVEHMHNPSEGFELLFSLLEPRGWLGIMTKMVESQRAFSTWHYINDKTHVSFFSRGTFLYLADRFDATVQFKGKDVILFNRN